jgi:ankyrin repeat protein
VNRRADRALADARSAVHRDDADGLQNLLSENPELFTRQFGHNNETLLTEAARAGKINAVQTILTQALTTRDFLFTAIVNHQNAMGNSALMLAIEQGHLGVVDSLLVHPRTRVNIVNKDFRTPRHLMAEHPDVTWAARLVDGTEIVSNLRDCKLDKPLRVVAEHQD